MRNIKSAEPVPDPPAHLSDAAQALWRRLVPSQARSFERQQLVVVALEAWDRLRQIRDVLRTEGLTTTTEKTGAVHVHPLLKMETELRKQFATIWGKLNLHWIMPVDGRTYPEE